MSIGDSPQRKSAKLKKYLDKLSSQQQLRDSRLSTNIKPERAFYLITKRIEWLNAKICYNQDNNIPSNHFVEEREAMFWFMDKVKDLSEKLLKSGEGNIQ